MTSPALIAAERLLQQQQQQQAPAPAPEPLPTNFDPYAQQRIDFGRMLATWLKLNNFSLDTFRDLARASNTRHLQVHNSQLSPALKGNLDPKPKFFACLAHANSLIADQSWVTPSTGTVNLRARLAKAMPLTDPDGRVWDALDFFAAFIGQAR